MPDVETPAAEPEAVPAPASGADEPRLLAYLCNWCSYAGANLAGGSRLKYPATLRVIRVPCSGRVDPLMVFKAFERGLDGLLLGGCHLGDCHYNRGNYAAKGRMGLVSELLRLMGVEPQRFRLEWISASEGSRFRDVVTEMTADLEELGPLCLATGPLTVETPKD